MVEDRKSSWSNSNPFVNQCTNVWRKQTIETLFSLKGSTARARSVRPWVGVERCKWTKADLEKSNPLSHGNDFAIHYTTFSYSKTSIATVQPFICCKTCRGAALWTNSNVAENCLKLISSLLGASDVQYMQRIFVWAVAFLIFRLLQPACVGHPTIAMLSMSTHIFGG